MKDVAKAIGLGIALGLTAAIGSFVGQHAAVAAYNAAKARRAQ